MKNSPYIRKRHVIIERFGYNPKYGNDRVCRCGHCYLHHFTYNSDATLVANIDNAGYRHRDCLCTKFKEQKPLA